MYIRYLWVPLVLLCSVSASLQAAEMIAQVVGNRFTWVSANTTSGYLSPSLWDIPFNLPVADKVIPGGPMDTSVSSINLIGTGGSVSVPISIYGAEYRLSSLEGFKPVSGTSSTQIKGNSVTVSGSGVGNLEVDLSSLESPITHYRPVFRSIDKNAWVGAFMAAKLPKGRYQAHINMNMPYDYYRSGVRIRNTLLFTTNIIVDYTPAVLNTIEVEGDGLITPMYHYPNTVSGKTEYVVNAKGYFPNGVLMGLKLPLSDSPFYEMVGKNPNEVIKYDVSCVSGCSGKNQIIVNGQGKLNTTDNRMKIDATSPTTAQAILQVGFNNKQMSELSNDTYRDSFVLIFEAAL
ncbi:hypothetical protein [Photobacterium kishitanii]|uniref:Fimbrial protein n=1 Tax=Photobacterium kishitanii TaxID=318456 RepID=A0A2T3K9Y9_9GAMM|nr:hypothetical protein [Photobacterium kishitanii]PSU87545.1 hypothetical protein C9J27_26090 [Photobacterium kishitanii]